jgi:hypothetical protein
MKSFTSSATKRYLKCLSVLLDYDDDDNDEDYDGDNDNNNNITVIIITNRDNTLLV